MGASMCACSAESMCRVCGLSVPAWPKSLIVARCVMHVCASLCCGSSGHLATWWCVRRLPRARMPMRSSVAVPPQGPLQVAAIAITPVADCAVGGPRLACVRFQAQGLGFLEGCRCRTSVLVAMHGCSAFVVRYCPVSHACSSLCFVRLRLSSLWHLPHPPGRLCYGGAERRTSVVANGTLCVLVCICMHSGLRG